MVRWFDGAKSVTLLGLTLLSCGCSQEVHDTEGRVFEPVCKEGACSLLLQSTVSSDAPEDAAPDSDSRKEKDASSTNWEVRRQGRILTACPSQGPQHGYDCRPITCETGSVCSKLGGSGSLCQADLCQNPNREITRRDRLALCLAGTGAWEKSRRQRTRITLALSCRPPCEVPGKCRAP